MILYYKIKKPTDFVFDHLTNIQKFVSIHPIIYKMDDLGNGNYKVYEKLGFVSSSPREGRAGRGLRRGEFPIIKLLLSPALSSTLRRRGRGLGVGRVLRQTHSVRAASLDIRSGRRARNDALTFGLWAVRNKKPGSRFCRRPPGPR